MSTNFGDNTFFKEPEARKYVGRFLRCYERATPQDVLSKYPESAPTEIVIEFEPVNFNLRDGDSVDACRMGVSNSNRGKLAKTLASWEAVTGVRPNNDSAWNSQGQGLYFEWTNVPLNPNERPNSNGNVTRYRKFERVVPTEEALTLAASRAPQSAAGGAPSPITQADSEDATELLLSRLGDGKTDQEIKAMVIGDPVLKILSKSVFYGTLFRDLQESGKLIRTGDRYLAA